MTAQKDVFTLQDDRYEIRISSDDDEVSIDPSINNPSTIVIGGETRFNSMGCITLELIRPTQGIWNVVVPGYFVKAYEHCARLIEDALFIAVGSYLCRFDLSQLELAWSTQVDPSTCFGLYYAPEFQCFITHGELDIARVSLAGHLDWCYSGADIFTTESGDPDFKINGGFIEVTDWTGLRHRISIQDGKSG